MIWKWSIAFLIGYGLGALSFLILAGIGMYLAGNGKSEETDQAIHKTGGNAGR